jgi:hypothetical protein
MSGENHNWDMIRMIVTTGAGEAVYRGHLWEDNGFSAEIYSSNGEFYKNEEERKSIDGDIDLEIYLEDGGKSVAIDLSIGRELHQFKIPRK